MANQSDNKNKYHTEILKATDSWTVLISDSINDNTLSIYTFQLFKYNIMYCKKNVWNNGCEWCWLFLGEIAHNGNRTQEIWAKMHEITVLIVQHTVQDCDSWEERNKGSTYLYNMPSFLPGGTFQITRRGIPADKTVFLKRGQKDQSLGRMR